MNNTRTRTGSRLVSPWLLAIAVALLTGSPVALAQEEPLEPVFKANNRPQATLRYWTAERLQSAKPMPMPQVRIDRLGAEPEPVRRENEVSVGSPARRPTLPQQDADPFLFYPLPKRRPQSELQPRNVGLASLYFTSSRLIPQNADRQYPYRTVGKLFFNITGQGAFVCSAAVINKKVVLTAGHCLHDGSQFFKNFLFIPAYRNGAAPYGQWTAQWIGVTGPWAATGQVPNLSDFGILVVTNSGAKEIGERTGWLGWWTYRIPDNHIHQLGYPSALDNGEKMHQVTAGNSVRLPERTVGFGSDMGPGASGGPWVMNFGKAANGQGAGEEPAPPNDNRVVGVNSFGPTGQLETLLLISGSSILNDWFVDLFLLACDDNPGACA